jgi:hypothetical protein
MLGLWVIWPRFDIWAPSVVDDWSALDNAPKALHRLFHLAYDPDKVSDPHRYRPGYIAVWNSLQWHTLGAPGGLTGPNFWNLLRLALFIGALILVTVSVAGFSPRRTIGPVWLGALAAAPPAMVLATPASGEDFARFGPVEPMLVAGMTLGALTLAYATRRLVGLQRRSLDRSTLLPLGLALAGYALWLLGVYEKEASICFLVPAPFLYLFLSRRWREAGVIDKPLFRYRVFQIVAAAMLVPVLHMGFEILKLAGEGTTVYGAPVPSGTGGTIARLRSAFDLQWNAQIQILGTAFWKDVLVAGSLLLGWVALRQRRIPWLEAGLIAGGWAALVFQGLSGTATPRYYIPTMALFGVAIALLATKSMIWTRLIVITAAAIFVLNNAGGSRDTVTAWAAGDKDANRAVELLANLNPERCPVYMSGLEEEVADAFPVLVALREPFPPGPCGQRFEAFMLRRQHPERITPVTNEKIMRACAGGWVPYQGTEVWQIMACPRLAGGRARGQPVDQILSEDRLVPGRRFSERP